MKLRLQSNSIRLRLKRAEVKRLAESGCVEEKIMVGAGAGGAFCYALKSSREVSVMQAELKANGIVVSVPAKAVDEWANGEDVGLEAEVPADGQKLRIIIEKDFACLNGPPEQNVDTFPNPLAGTKC